MYPCDSEAVEELEVLVHDRGDHPEGRQPQLPGARFPRPWSGCNAGKEDAAEDGPTVIQPIATPVPQVRHESPLLHAAISVEVDAQGGAGRATRPHFVHL